MPSTSALAPSPIAASARLAALVPDVSVSRDGPVTVAVGESMESTLRAGTLVANALARGIAVISVLEPVAIYRWNAAGIPLPTDAQEERTRARWRFLERRLRDAAGAHDARVTVNVLRGSVARTIAHAARDLRSPYLVMGLGSHRPLERLLGGDTAARAVHHADCPVLAVTPAFTALPQVVVAGVDFSDVSAHAVRMAVPLLAPGGALHVVHAARPAAAPSDGSDRRLAAFVAGLDLPSHLPVRTAWLEGAPAERLLAYAAEVEAGMLVVGRHGRGMLDRLFVGSVASRVLRGAERAVLVVPEPSPSMRLQLAARRGARVVAVPREEWGSFLDRFSRRFAGRVVSLDTHDPGLALHTQERGSVLFGATWDPAAERVDVILGEQNGRRHLTRAIPAPSGLSSLVAPDGEPYGLHVTHGSGETLLTVVSPAVSRG